MKKGSKKQRYSEKFRAVALAKLVLAGYPGRKGAMTSVSKELDVPRTTLHGWINEATNPPPSEIRHITNEEIKTLLENELTAALEAMTTKRALANYKELGIVAAILFDKRQLMENQPTERVHHEHELTAKQRDDRALGYLTPQEKDELRRLATVRLIEDSLPLPTPYPLQSEIINSPARRKVICAGRRAGKTVMAAYMAALDLMEGKRVLLSSTSQDQSDAFWEYIVNWFAPLHKTEGFYKNEGRRIITWRGGKIRVKTGSNPDALRSDWADLLVLDECAYLDPRAWRQVGVPLMADSLGTAVFISTPVRRNWFFELYNQALITEEWAAWQFPTHKNPHITTEALEMLTRDMTESAYQEEILAQFLEGAGVVFRYVDECATSDICPPYEGRFVFGVDWAQKNDYTVIVVLDKKTLDVVDFDRFNQVDWSIQRGRLRALYDLWKPDTIWAESNSIGSPNIEALQKEGLPVYAFETTASSKPPLIESLVLAFDRREIRIIDDPIFKGEFMAYERNVTATGRSQYSAPAGLHDDIVIATAIAWHGAIAGNVKMAVESQRYA